MASASSAEKNLLREITFLSRLIDHHKLANQLPSRRIQTRSSAVLLTRSPIGTSRTTWLRRKSNHQVNLTAQFNQNKRKTANPAMSCTRVNTAPTRRVYINPNFQRQNPAPSKLLVQTKKEVKAAPEFNVISKTKLVRNQGKTAVVSAKKRRKLSSSAASGKGKVPDMVKIVTPSRVLKVPVRSGSKSKVNKRAVLPKKMDSVRKLGVSGARLQDVGGKTSAQRAAAVSPYDSSRSPQASGEVLCVSRNRFVRIQKSDIAKVMANSSPPPRKTPPLVRQRSRDSATIRSAKAVVSKYNRGQSRFKVDHRPWNKRTPGLVKQVKPYSLSYVARTPQDSRKRRSGVKVSRKGKSPAAKVLNIGGILYRASPTQLARTGGKPPGTTPAGSRVILVRGNRFCMDPGGRTLRRISKQTTSPLKMPPAVTPLRRVDIGGVTYIQRHPGVLERTDLHVARSRATQSVNRSIKTLRRRKMINQHCMFFYRFGTCARKNKGRGCPYIHDQKKVALCQRFLRGECQDTSCKLSHEASKERMPACRFFLEGGCNRDACPYLHVKVNANADVCKDFREGYCPAGDMCKKKHVFDRPDWNKGKRHRLVSVRAAPPKKKQKLEVLAPRKRYFEEQTDKLTPELQEKKARLMRKVEMMKNGWVQDHESNQEPVAASRKEKLESQPAYIPL